MFTRCSRIFTGLLIGLLLIGFLFTRLLLIGSLLRRSEDVLGYLRGAADERQRFDFSRLIGNSTRLRTALRRTSRVIPRGKATVLITAATSAMMAITVKSFPRIEPVMSDSIRISISVPKSRSSESILWPHLPTACRWSGAIHPVKSTGFKIFHSHRNCD